MDKNNRPKWWLDFAADFVHNTNLLPNCPVGYDPKEGPVIKPYTVCNCQFSALEMFILKVEQEAYERGYSEGKSEVEDDIKYNYDIRELV